MLPLPKINSAESLEVQTKRGLKFPSPLGLADSFVTEGKGLDGIMD